jgi:hypothetical protein
MVRTQPVPGRPPEPGGGVPRGVAVRRPGGGHFWHFIRKTSAVCVFRYKYFHMRLVLRMKCHKCPPDNPETPAGGAVMAGPGGGHIWHFIRKSSAVCVFRYKYFHMRLVLRMKCHKCPPDNPETPAGGAAMGGPAANQSGPARRGGKPNWLGSARLGSAWLGSASRSSIFS